MGVLSLLSQSNKLMKEKHFQSVVQKKFTLTQTKESIDEYQKNMTGGKFLLCPNDLDENLTDQITEFGEEFDLNE